MRAFNLGCGPEVFEDGYMGYDQWRNVDNVYKHPRVENVDLRYSKPLVGEGYDLALVNHVLCTMKPQEVKQFLDNTYDILRPGGSIVVIDVDLMKAYADYFMNEGRNLPIDEPQNKDYKLCMHLSGYGTRLSLYTIEHMKNVLELAGFKQPHEIESPFNTRPNESLVIGATK